MAAAIALNNLVFMWCEWRSFLTRDKEQVEISSPHRRDRPCGGTVVPRSRLWEIIDFIYLNGRPNAIARLGYPRLLIRGLIRRKMTGLSPPPMIKASHLRLWLALIFLPARLFALDAANSEWFTRVWQIDDGLLDNNVNGIVQGPDGYLWIVTPVGLMQFDGASFNAFPLEPFTGPRASHVRTLVCGRTGVLWMGADG